MELYTDHELQKVTTNFKKYIQYKQNNNNPKELHNTKTYSDKNMYLDTFLKPKPDILSEKPITITKILAIDIGGSFLKLVLYIFNKETKKISKLKNLEKYSLTQNDIVNVDLFEFVAQKVKLYLQDINLQEEELHSAVTFSYPLQHKSISSGSVLVIGKNPKFKKIEVGVDPVQRLNELFKNMGIVVKIILNDTTATLCSSLGNNKFIIGLVLGTGCNAAYTAFDKNKIINIEWARYDDKSLKYSEFDVKLKEEMIKQGVEYQPIDNLIGGGTFVQMVEYYLGRDMSIDKINKKIAEYKVDENKTELILIIEKIKSRTAQLLSGLIMGIVLANDEYDGMIIISLNGSAYENKKSYDFDLLKKTLKKVCEGIEFDFDRIEFEINEDASLIGSVKALLSEYYGIYIEDEKNEKEGVE